MNGLARPPLQQGYVRYSYPHARRLLRYGLRGLQLYARFESESGEGVANSYDNLGRLTTSVSTMGGAVRTLTYAYDAGSNRTRITYPGGLSFAYAYNGANQLTSIIDEGNAIGIVGYFYDSLSRPFVKFYHLADHSVYYYDARSRLNFQSEGFVGGVGDVQRNHSYNPANQMVSRTLSNEWTCNGFAPVSLCEL